MRRPFYWKRRRAWFVKSPDGRRNIYLADAEGEAQTRWAEMIAAQQSRGSDALVAAVVAEFLLLTEKDVTASTFSSRGKYLADFCSVHGYKRVRDLLPIDVTKWLADHHSWGTSSQRAAISAIKRALNWSIDQGLIESHPLGRLRKPEGARREHVITADEHAAMMAAADDGRRPGGRLMKLGRRAVRRDTCFRQVLIALHNTGGRPGMIGAARIENISVDFSTLSIPFHKTRKKTGRPLTIYLSPCLQTLIRIVIAGRTAGPIFLNTRGRAWSSNAIRCRMRRLREKLNLPAGVVAYAFRHTYTTNAIVAGNDPLTVAELLGHKDGSMIAKHYSHLSQNKEHMKKAAARAISRD
jgi:integrase